MIKTQQELQQIQKQLKERLGVNRIMQQHHYIKNMNSRLEITLKTFEQDLILKDLT